jgi:tetratricopeptide (TPR) repeat protein
MLSKKKKILKAIKLNQSISLKSIFQIGNSKKQHPTYQKVIKELEEKNYKNAEHCCKEFLKTFPKSYSMRCILAYSLRCLNNYEETHTYLKEAIDLKRKKPNAWYIRGEVNFRQGNYGYAIENLKSSINYNAKINILYVMIGISYHNDDDDENALKNFKIALQNDPNNYLCLKYCVYIYEKQEKHSDTLKVLNKLLNINENDSLILCYYGEILSNMEKHNEAILYFTKATNIDPENVHNLNKRAIAYYNLKKYDNALLDLSKVIQLDFSNSLAYFYKGLIHNRMGNRNSFIVAIDKYIELTKFNFQLSTLTNNLLNNLDQIVECEMNIELKKYKDAELILNKLFRICDNDISLACLIQKYSDFWSYCCSIYNTNYNSFTMTKLGITNDFNIYMYGVNAFKFIIP